MKKNVKSPSINKHHTRIRNVPPRQQQQQQQPPPQQQNYNNKRSPKEKYYRKKVKDGDATKKTDEYEDSPRNSWLWNVNCDFWPNCRNSSQCPFKHPTDKGSVVRRRRTTPKSGDAVGKPINCRFGAECSRMDCWFWHPGDDETFIDPSSIPSSPKSTNISNSNELSSPINTNDDQPILTRLRTTSSTSSNNTDSLKQPPSVSAASVTTENSYDIEESSDFSPTKSIENNNVSTSTSAVIITKTTHTNPWNKIKSTSSSSKTAASATATKTNNVNNNNNSKIDAKMLSPNTFKEKRLSSHSNFRPPAINPPQPLSAHITVGAVYHSEFDISDYNINNMVPNNNNNNNVSAQQPASAHPRSRTLSHPPPPPRQPPVPQKQYLRRNSARDHNDRRKNAYFSQANNIQRVKSNLNPNASSFDALQQSQQQQHAQLSHQHHLHVQEQQQPRTAPIRPPIRSSHFFSSPPTNGMNVNHNKHKNTSHGNGNGHGHGKSNHDKVSSPFDPHSQLQNGGVFTPHNALSPTSPNNTNNGHGATANRFHSNMTVPKKCFVSDTKTKKNNKNDSSSTMQTTTTTISTVTINQSQSRSHHHHSRHSQMFGALGTHITSPTSSISNTSATDHTNQYTSSYQTTYANHANNYQYDEYKQAPNSAAAAAATVYSTNYQYDYGDESKVIDYTNNDDQQQQHNNNNNGRSRDDDDTAASHPWICPPCSFLNEIGTRACEMCGSKRPINDDVAANTGTTEEQSPLDFDFNVQDIMNNNDNIQSHRHSDRETLSKNLSFTSLFFGSNHNDDRLPLLSSTEEMIAQTIQNQTPMTSPIDSIDQYHSFQVGDQVLHNINNESIQGTIIEIREISESPFPIRIQYYEPNEFNKTTQKFMWVLPQELVKLDSIVDEDDYYHVGKHDVEGFLGSAANSSELNKRILDMDDADTFNQYSDPENHLKETAKKMIGFVMD